MKETTSKKCTKCAETKPITQYNKCKGARRAYCKSCHAAESIKWHRSNADKRRAHTIAYQRNWRANNKEKTKEYGRRSYKKLTPEQKKQKAHKSRMRSLQRKYGISAENWQMLYERQGGLCALCRVPGRTGRHGILSVDHCHETGRIRGLLCTPCNSAIGILGESRERIARVLAYVSGFDLEGQRTIK